MDMKNVLNKPLLPTDSLKKVSKNDDSTSKNVEHINIEELTTIFNKTLSGNIMSLEEDFNLEEESDGNDDGDGDSAEDAGASNDMDDTDDLGSLNGDDPDSSADSFDEGTDDDNFDSSGDDIDDAEDGVENSRKMKLLEILSDFELSIKNTLDAIREVKYGSCTQNVIVKLQDLKTELADYTGAGNRLHDSKEVYTQVLLFREEYTQLANAVAAASLDDSNASIQKSNK